jgi:hypothetical protein
MAGRFDPVIAKQHLTPHITRLRAFSYARLSEKVRSHDIETYESVGPDGVMYQIEILFLWMVSQTLTFV